VLMNYRLRILSDHRARIELLHSLQMLLIGFKRLAMLNPVTASIIEHDYIQRPNPDGDIFQKPF
jgi:hypothetical protein